MGLHLGLVHGALRAFPGIARCSELKTAGSKLGFPLIYTPSKLPTFLTFSAKVWVQSFSGLGSGVALCLSLINRIYISKRVEYCSQPSSGVE